MKIFPSFALSTGMLYSSSRQLLNTTREYTAAEIYNATASANVKSMGLSFEEALA